MFRCTAITPLSAQFSFNRRARHGLYVGGFKQSLTQLSKGLTLWMTPHSNKIIGTNENPAQNVSCRMQWLFKRRCRRTVLESIFETNFTWKQFVVATWKFRSPQKTSLDHMVLDRSIRSPCWKVISDHPVEVIFTGGWRCQEKLFSQMSSSYPSFHQEMEKSKNPMAAMMKIGQQLEAQKLPQQILSLKHLNFHRILPKNAHHDMDSSLKVESELAICDVSTIQAVQKKGQALETSGFSVGFVRVDLSYRFPAPV